METKTSTPNSNVVATDGNNNPPAPNNVDFSNSRIKKMMNLHISDIQRKNSQNVAADEDKEPVSADATKKESKVGEPANGAAQDGTSLANKDEGKTSPKAKIDYEAEARKHQSRADQAEQKLKDIEATIAQKDKEISELQQAKKLVDGFTKDPVGFLKEYAPEMYNQFLSAGSPSELASKHMAKFKSSLDEQFKKQYGQDWSYSESEALNPDSPSFRYKLAYDEELNAFRNSYRDYIEKQREKIQNANKAIEKDKESLRAEFGFTDEDFKKVDEFAANNEITYGLVARMALFDKILSSKLAGLVPQAPLPPDLSNASGGSVNSQKVKEKISPQMRQIISRVGMKSLH